MKWEFIRGDETCTYYGADMNSLGSYFVQLEDLAELIIDADEDAIEMDAIYRGWFNTFYKTKSKAKTRSDILMLGNGLAEWTIPQDTIPHGIYLTIDTQKDHFWYTVLAYQYGATPHIVSKGKIWSFNDIERLFLRQYKNMDGDEFYISKLAIDYQGYVNKEVVIDEDGNEIVVENIDRMDEVKTWAVGFMRKVGYDRIFLTRGVEELPNQVEFAEFKIKIKDELVGQEVDIKAWKMSNLRCASILDQKIEKSIERAKSENPDEYQSSLFFINQDDIDYLADEEHKSVAVDLDRQLRSEVLEYKDSKAKKMTYVRKSRENHLWDTCKMGVMLAAVDNLASIPKPAVVEQTENIANDIAKLF
jgi:hypothetical protein